METTQTSTIASKDSRSAWRKTDTMWMLGLYGTAIGAGVLFLPINAGVGGMIPLIIMAILAFPMTFFAHRGLTRFVLSVKWFTEFGHLNRGDMLTSEQHRCHNEKKKFQRRV